MGYATTPTNNYVKFVRGTKEYYSQLTKNNDTLYFVYDEINSTTGELYLGNKRIGGGNITSIADLIEGTVEDGYLLIYDQVSDSWIPSSIDDAIRSMTGATNAANGQSGLVPVPHAGDQNKFLRGDGTWTDITIAELSAVDNVTIGIENDKFSIKGFSSAPVGTLLQKTSNGLEWVPSVDLKPKYKKVESINQVNEEATIYFVPNNKDGNNVFDEYMYIDGQPEIIGTTVANLDDYVTKTNFNNLSSIVNNKVNISTFTTAINEINEKLTWQEMVEQN